MISVQVVDSRFWLMRVVIEQQATTNTTFVTIKLLQSIDSNQPMDDGPWREGLKFDLCESKWGDGFFGCKE